MSILKRISGFVRHPKNFMSSVHGQRHVQSQFFRKVGGSRRDLHGDTFKNYKKYKGWLDND